MNDKLIIGVGVLLIAIIAVFYIKGSSFESHQHNFEVMQKVEKDKKYYIIGKDPSLHNSEEKTIEVSNKDFNIFQENEVYYIKYENSDNKGNILSSYEEN